MDPAVGPPNVPKSTTDFPVNYVDGIPVIDSTDIASDGFGKTWSQSRSWSPADELKVNGNSWVASQLPQLLAVDSDTVVLVESGTAEKRFSTSDGINWSAHHYLKDTPTYTPGAGGTPGEFTLADTNGNRLVFLDLHDGRTANQGELVRFVDAGGNVTEVVSRSSSGPTEVQRKDVSGTALESWLYSYSSDRITDVALRRPDGAGGWRIVRQVHYQYYASGATYGNDGDLELVTIRDGAGNTVGSGNILDNVYYRYYTAAGVAAGQVGYVGGIKLVVNAEAYGRLAADPAVANPLTASDAKVKEYADNYFEYDAAIGSWTDARGVTRYRVTK
jgi:hypothetical protein